MCSIWCRNCWQCNSNDWFAWLPCRKSVSSLIDLLLAADAKPRWSRRPWWCLQASELQKHAETSKYFRALLDTFEFRCGFICSSICIICIHDYPCALSSPCFRLWGGLARFLSRVLQQLFFCSSMSLCVSLWPPCFKCILALAGNPLKIPSNVWKLEFQARWTVGVSFGLLCKRRCWRISTSSIHLHSTRSTREFQHEPKFQGPTLGDFDRFWQIFEHIQHHTMLFLQAIALPTKMTFSNLEVGLIIFNMINFNQWSQIAWSSNVTHWMLSCWQAQDAGHWGRCTGGPGAADFNSSAENWCKYI